MSEQRVDGDEVVDLSFERLERLDKRIDADEDDAIRARWDFGHLMLAARDGAGRLPNGWLTRLADVTGKSRTELSYRSQLASAYPTEAELLTAVSNSSSWTDLRSTLKKHRANQIALVPAPTELPEGVFSTIVADPPWQFGNTVSRGAASDHYPTMSLEELCELDVTSRAADDSHLYLWVPTPLLENGFSVLNAWGFTYKTTLVWTKPQLGMGSWYRVGTEFLLFGVKGDLKTLRKDRRNFLEAPRTKHSAKPVEFQDLIAEMSPGPHLELFSRCEGTPQCLCSSCRLGWATWGNQAATGGVRAAT